MLGACAGPTDAGEDATPTTTAVPTDPVLHIVSVPDESRSVGPPATSPLALVRRDCGQSVPLPAGGALWLYCDTTMFTAGDDDAAPPTLRWFVNTSAAVATADDPLVMIDAVDAGGRPRPVVTPRSGYPVCESGQGRFSWPAAAVPVDGGPDGSGAPEQLVAIYYGNVCVVPGAYLGGDLGVALLEPPASASDPTEPVLLEATIADDRVFGREPTGNPFGQAAVRDGDDVYVYRCPPADEPCQVARVAAAADLVADPSAYDVWTGSSWAPYGHDGEAAAPMEMPGAVRGLKPSVEWLPDLGAFVWADHLFTDPGRVALRVARQPWGPWSPPVVVDLPGCADFYPLICFAVEAHEQLSSADTIGLTWYDPSFDAGRSVPLRYAAIRVVVADR